MASPLITLLILLFVYAIKGIYPFGSRSVAYYDMVQQYIPFYFNTWDVYHGVKSLFFDWSAGLGGSMADNVGNYIINPFNLFFLFIKREDIFNSMSLFLAIKLTMAAFFMSFYVFRKNKSSSLLFGIVAGVSYAFCAYNLQYYSNIQFLDVVTIFPILIYGHDSLVDRKKPAVYTIVLTICMITSIYLSYMICLYLIIRTFLRLIKMDKEGRYKVAFDFAFYSLVSFLLSSVVVIPTVVVLLSSSRNEVWNASGGYFGALNALVSAYGDSYKTFMLFGCEGLFSIVLFLCLFDRKTLKSLYEHLILIILLIVPIFVEGTDLLWHIGGYVHFPMRFGYILSFEVITFMADYFAVNKENPRQKNITAKICLILTCLLLPIVIYDLYKFTGPFRIFGIRELSPYSGTFVYILFSCICIFLSLVSINKNFSIYTLSTLLVCESAFGAWGFIGPEKELSSECSDALLTPAIELSDYEYLSTPMIRCKNIGNSLVTNYAFVTGFNTASDWTSGTNSNLLALRSLMGYSNAYTRILDEGGTVFTDELFGVTNILSKDIENSSLYTYEDKVVDFYIYSSNYVLPYSINLKSIPELPEFNDLFDFQNQLFTEFTGLNQSLISTEYSHFGNLAGSDLESGLWLDLDIEGERTLYVYASGAEFGFMINGEPKQLNYLTFEDNYVYPTPFCNGLLELGTYKDETVRFGMIPNPEYTGNVDSCYVMIGLMDNDLLREGNEIMSAGEASSVSIDKNTLSISGIAEKDGYLMLPVGFNTGFRCAVNGKKISPQSGLNDSLLFVPVGTGEYNLSISFVPEGLYIGICISLLGVILLFGYGLMSKKSKEIGKFIYYLIYAGCAVILIFMYFVPVFFNILLRIIK
ncbi:MAG: YfhO family protein [Lachnospiraceae bacterium]|nr:YfhO family protein [Lachnospiraceae bacterium]